MINYRRGFIKKLLAGGAAASAVTPMLAHADDKQKIRLRMQTYWGKEVGDIFKVLADNVKVASEGSLRIKVYEGGSIVPDSEMLDAVPGQMLMKPIIFLRTASSRC